MSGEVRGQDICGSFGRGIDTTQSLSSTGELTTGSVLGEATDFSVKLWELIARRAALYTMGDSSSLPAPVAYDLSRSVCFVLGIDLADSTERIARLSTLDLEGEFQKGLEAIQAEVERGETLWRQVRHVMPLIHNIALRDTLESIGDFWQRYDPRFFAHEIVCDIDYPLCHPVSESLLGVDYVTEYLRRLLIEGRFIGCFDTSLCEALLERCCPDYRGLLINLYEPIAVNACGLSLIGADPLKLDITTSECAELCSLLAPCGPAAISRLLQEAAYGLCATLHIEQEAARDHLTAAMMQVQPRLRVALAHDALANLFCSFA
jgi:hypothetical protein